MEVKFYTFSKKRNSTAQPSSTATTFQVTLKDSSGVLHPVLEIYNNAAWNPSSLNYAYIANYGRYYWIDDWTYIGGRWEAALSVDPLASWKSEIGSSYKYVLRAAAEQNKDAIDDLYPALASEPSIFKDTESFAFAQALQYGQFIIGMSNRDNVGAGAITYYSVTASQIRQMMQYMLIATSDLWTNGFQGMTDTLYRAIYSPVDYIKSCKWFPLTQAGSIQSTMMFGNYDSGIAAMVLGYDASSWNAPTRTLSLPSDWNTRAGKYKSNPGCHIYIRLNPWGVIELNPMDLIGATGVHLRILCDYISGEGMLEVSRSDSGTLTLLTQRSAQIGMDINLSQASINASGLFNGILGVAGGIAQIASGGAASAGALAIAGGIGGAASSAVPSMSGSTGGSAGSIRSSDGVALLECITREYPEERPLELGYPLLKNKTISTLSGYIKCADGEVNCAGMPEELEALENHLTTGFFYE